MIKKQRGKKKVCRATARIERNKREAAQFKNIVGRMSREEQISYFGRAFDIDATTDFKDRSWTTKNSTVFSKFLTDDKARRELGN